ncbi:Nodule Cysteine-Rich (NCR) secreted peptide [Medicago truncatula]|uniref:Nodule Cysteine-Rich (NCR) secreted peptide n=1 Tax=Medicago truncatula TaxID=3880 RepID=A0A072VIP2_MEDTR|nr:Nodule Cysteine-Rich (NCR) secreted peptide [Medicago truncatula]
MTEIVKYVYVIIIFLSLFLVATNIKGKPFYHF